jgi:hypothetical protein
MGIFGIIWIIWAGLKGLGGGGGQGGQGGQGGRNQNGGRLWLRVIVGPVRVIRRGTKTMSNRNHMLILIAIMAVCVYCLMFGESGKTLNREMCVKLNANSALSG